MATAKPRLHTRRSISAHRSQLGAYLRDIAVRAPLPPAEQLRLCKRLSAATRRFRLVVYSVPWVHRRVLGIWRDARRAGRASSRMSDSFGVHAPEDRERLERCLETLEASWRTADATTLAHVLLEADLSHEILRRLHRELLWLGGLASDCPDSSLLEKELGHTLAAFRERLQEIGAAFEEMSALKNELVESNLELVLAQAVQFEHLGLPVADLVQEGNAGLLRAAERFDPHRGVAFVTYALWWIRHGMVRAVQNHGRTVRLPSHRQDEVRDFRKRQQGLEQELGREVTRDEVAAAFGIEESRVDELCCLQAAAVSLDSELSREGAEAPKAWVDVLRDPEALCAVDAVERANLLGCVLAEIESLPARERRILLLRYGLDSGSARSLREVGLELSLSGERVRQLEASALGRLRRRLCRNHA